MITILALVGIAYLVSCAVAIYAFRSAPVVELERAVEATPELPARHSALTHCTCRRCTLRYARQRRVSRWRHARPSGRALVLRRSAT